MATCQAYRHEASSNHPTSSPPHQFLFKIYCCQRSNHRGTVASEGLGEAIPYDHTAQNRSHYDSTCTCGWSQCIHPSQKVSAAIHVGIACTHNSAIHLYNTNELIPSYVYYIKSVIIHGCCRDIQALSPV